MIYLPPSAEAGYARATWCRPLSGCSPSAPADGPATCSSAASLPPAGELLPPIVALGKFDALHKGHRALAAAAAELGGAPWLVSFSGMAEVLGWPARLPLVAPCDRRRVLATWAQHCQGRTPRECAVPFAEVRRAACLHHACIANVCRHISCHAWRGRCTGMTV